jgi:DNA-binding MarR family transcriptional regulator
VVPKVFSTVTAQARRGGHNLAPNHFRILRMLSQKPSKPSELAKQMDVSFPSMSSTVETLVKRGWLERSRSADDRRVTDLRVSARGQKVLEEEYERVLSWTAELLEKLDAAQIKKVEEGLDTLRHLFEDEADANMLYSISVKARRLRMREARTRRRSS